MERPHVRTHHRSSKPGGNLDKRHQCPTERLKIEIHFPDNKLCFVQWRDFNETLPPQAEINPNVVFRVLKYSPVVYPSLQIRH